MTLANLLDGILSVRQEASARGWSMDVICFAQSFRDILMTALREDVASRSSWEERQCTKEPERKDLYIYGAKVKWMGSTFPSDQVWYRYSPA